MLRVDGEDEVGSTLRNEAERALEAVQPAVAGEPTGADRDPRLEQVVAGAERVAHWVQEDLQALLLVPVEDVWQDRGGSHHQRRQRRQVEAGGAAQDQHPHQHRGEYHRGAEVGLEQDQNHRRSREGDGAEQRPELPLGALPDREVTSEHDQNDDLAQLGGLEREARDRDPAPGAEGRMAGEVDSQEEEQGGAVGREDEALQPAVVERCRDQVGDHTQEERQQLAPKVRDRGGVDGHQPEDDQHPHQQQLEAVELMEAAEPRHRRGSRPGGRGSSSGS